MQCQRCHGFMYRRELRDNKTMDCLHVLVCLMCGEIIDPMIPVNLEESSEDQPPKPLRDTRRTLPLKIQPERYRSPRSS